MRRVSGVVSSVLAIAGAAALAWGGARFVASSRPTSGVPADAPPPPEARDARTDRTDASESDGTPSGSDRQGRTNGGPYAAVPIDRVAGRVVDARGTPLPGATVRWLGAVDPGPAGDARPAPEPSGVTTDAAGEFSLPVPPAALGRRLAVRAPAHAPVVRDAPAPGTFVEIVLEDGAALEVRCVDERGRPVAGAQVEFRSGGVGGRDIAEGIAGPDGRFAFDAVPVGYGSVSAWKDGFGSGRATVGVSVASREPIVVVLRGHAVVAGTVSDAEDGRPIEGVEVAVRFVEHDDVPAAVARTDADGHYSLPLAAGPGTVLDVVASGASYADVAVRFPYDDAALGWARCDLRLGRGAAPVRGHVVDATGRGVAGADVAFGPAPSGLTSSPVRSGLDGSFSLPVPAWLSPGTRWPISAHAPTGVTAETVLVRAARSGDGEPIRLTLLGAGTVVATVTDAEGRPVGSASVDLRFDLIGLQRAAVVDGTPTEDWRTSIALQDPRIARALSAVTDASGRCTMRGVPAGAYHAAARHGRWVGRAAGPIRVDAGGVADAAITVGAGLTIAGVVRSVSGAPVAGATVFLVAGAGSPPGTPTSDARSGADGSFVLSHVPAGVAFSVHATAVGFGSAHRPGVGAGASGIELSLPPKGAIAGEVSVDGRPYVGTLTVWLTRRPRVAAAGADPRQSPAPVAHTRLATDGRFSVPDLVAGTYEVHVTTPEEGSSDVPVEATVVAGGEPVPVAVSLIAGGSVRGSIHRLDGSPAERASVIVRPLRPGGPRRVDTDTDGAFELVGLAAGGYRVRIEGRGVVPWNESLEIVAGGKIAVRWRERPAARLRVAVVDDAGRPIEGARVTLLDGMGAEARPDRARLSGGAGSAAGPDDLWVHATTTDARGELTIDALGAGTFIARAARRGFLAGTAGPIDVPESGTATLTVTLRPVPR